MIFVTGSEARASLRASRPRGSHSGAMDFAELERKEGVRLSWNAWPSSRIEATRVVPGMIVDMVATKALGRATAWLKE